MEAMSDSASVTVTVTQQGGYRFLVDFGESIPALQADEPVPLSGGAGPSPDQLLLAAISNCLSASLFFALQKFKQDAGGITTTATARIERNEARRLRVTQVSATIRLGKAGAEIAQLDRILGQFESFCTVTESVRDGIPVTVTVEDSQGLRLKEPVDPSSQGAT
jgi:uncharacterized OsmC-like protein